MGGSIRKGIRQMAGDTSEVCGTVKWTIMGTSSDGSKVEIEVTATLNEDGSITVDYGLADGSAEADIIGVYFDFFNNGGNVDKLGGGNNMKGYGDGFDVGYEEGEAGLKDPANVDGSMTFSVEELKKFDFVDLEGNALTGDGLMKAFAETEIGIRATSTGEDGEGSLKIGAVGEYCPPDEKDDDWFPDFKEKFNSDISNVVVYFNIPGEDGECKVYTVKIDNWEGKLTLLDHDGKPKLDEGGKIQFVTGENGRPKTVLDLSNDLDDSWDAILAYIIANDDNINEATPVLGAAIKGGRKEEFFGVDEYDTSGDTDPDEMPCGLQDFITDSSLDKEFDAVDVFPQEDVIA